jgi:hypothetical protein
MQVEPDLEEQRRAQEEARKVLEREQILQSETLRKRLAEKRNRAKNQGDTLNLTTSNFIENYGAEKIDSPFGL